MIGYLRTFIVGVLGILGFLIGYLKNIPITTQISIGIGTFVGVMLIGVYERRIQLEQVKKTLIENMKYHLNHVFVMNHIHAESENPIEAQELNRYFHEYDETMRLKAMAIVFDVSIEKVSEMLAETVPEYITKNLHVFKLPKY